MSDPNHHRLVTELLVQLGRLAREARSRELPDGRLLVVRIDEIQNAGSAHALSGLLTALGDALDETIEELDAAGLRRERLLPLVVCLSGVPDFRRAAWDAGATFSRRFKTEELEPAGRAHAARSCATPRCDWRGSPSSPPPRTPWTPIGG